MVMVKMPFFGNFTPSHLRAIETKMGFVLFLFQKSLLIFFLNSSTHLKPYLTNLLEISNLK